MMNAVLLTGAGFTKTFGGYLASEMWAAILNQPEVQGSPTLLQGMRDEDNLDYESFYASLQETDSQLEKENLSAAIRNAFLEMEDSIRTKKPLEERKKCCEFMTRIAQQQKPSFIFTLNQDFFFERYYNRELPVVAPGLPNHFTRFADLNREESATAAAKFRLLLPTPADLEETKKDLFEKGFAQIAYVKLHGSQGWLSYDKQDVLVIGTQKAELIAHEPLLAWYFELFETVINRPDTRLLTVGYGFGDRHINEAIVRAMNSGLKLYVISPQLPLEFKSQLVGPLNGPMVTKPLGKELWDGLVQYWPDKITEFYQTTHDLSHKGRALFKSLGLQ